MDTIKCYPGRRVLSTFNFNSSVFIDRIKHYLQAVFHIHPFLSILTDISISPLSLTSLEGKWWWKCSVSLLPHWVLTTGGHWELERWSMWPRSWNFKNFIIKYLNLTNHIYTGYRKLRFLCQHSWTSSSPLFSSQW